jgi:tetratricopeptide (TPR) repeat protein
VAAELAGDEPSAYAAARRGSELWPEPPWTDRFADLQHRWVWARIVKAERLLDGGHPEEALAELDLASSLEADREDARLIEARALLALEREDEAVELFETLADEPEALLALGRIAEQDGDWLKAMEIYGALPPGTPDRDRLLRRVQLRWRRQNLPTQVQEALESTQLTREELAALLVGLVPETQAIGGGRVPVLSDIVDLGSQREILTAVRLDMMTADRIEHRFHPERVATIDEIRRAVDRLSELLEREQVVWCDEGSVISFSCTALSAPVSGAALGEIIFGLAHEEGR